jgi:hypothetical protein
MVWTFFRQHRGRVAGALCRSILLTRAMFRLTVGMLLSPVFRLLRPNRKTSLTNLRSHWKLLKWALGFTGKDHSGVPVEVRP